MKWFHRRRLERLADKLTGKGAYAKIGPVPAHKFDMEYIFSECRGGVSSFRSQFNPTECKTAACALGWGLSDPWFQQRGLLGDAGPKFWGISSSQFSYLFIASAYGDGRFVKASIVATRLRRAARTV